MSESLMLGYMQTELSDVITGKVYTAARAGNGDSTTVSSADSRTTTPQTDSLLNRIATNPDEAALFIRVEGMEILSRWLSNTTDLNIFGFLSKKSQNDIIRIVDAIIHTCNQHEPGSDFANATITSCTLGNLIELASYCDAKTRITTWQLASRLLSAPGAIERLVTSSVLALGSLTRFLQFSGDPSPTVTADETIALLTLLLQLAQNPYIQRVMAAKPTTLDCLLDQARYGDGMGRDDIKPHAIALLRHLAGAIEHEYGYDDDFTKEFYFKTVLKPLIENTLNHMNPAIRPRERGLLQALSQEPHACQLIIKDLAKRYNSTIGVIADAAARFGTDTRPEQRRGVLSLLQSLWQANPTTQRYIDTHLQAEEPQLFSALVQHISATAPERPEAIKLAFVEHHHTGTGAGAAAAAGSAAEDPSKKEGCREVYGLYGA